MPPHTLESSMATKGGAIVGLGRAGRIHVKNAEKWVGCKLLYGVEPNEEAAKALALPEGCKVVGKLEEALDDPAVNFVIVATPTPLHSEHIMQSLKAGKHVFAEKPLCLKEKEITPLFQEAEKRGLLLFTAYNRRYDPRIQEAKRRVQSREKGRPLTVVVVSRDYPYPPAAYLRESCNLFKDCVVHDLDTLTWVLDEQPESIQAEATCSNDERSEGMWDNSCVHLRFPSGVTATIVSSRFADSYDQRYEFFCERGVISVTNPDGDVPISFGERYADSYVGEVNSFLEQLHANDHAPNLSCDRTHQLDKLVKMCEMSARNNNQIVTA